MRRGVVFIAVPIVITLAIVAFEVIWINFTNQREQFRSACFQDEIPPSECDRIFP